MKAKKSLADTNKYLKEPNKRQKLIRRSVLTSSAVEGINVKLSPLTGGKVVAKSKEIKETRRSAKKRISGNSAISKSNVNTNGSKKKKTSS